MTGGTGDQRSGDQVAGAQARLGVVEPEQFGQEPGQQRNCWSWFATKRSGAIGQ
jgi:hypothetical protein